MLLFFGTWVEGQALDPFYPLYVKGSYTLSEMRVNGFFDEASTLSSTLTIFYAPLFMALFVAGKCIKRPFVRKAALIGLGGVLFVLLTARSTTATIAYVAICLYLCARFINLKSRITLYLAALAICLLVGIALLDPKSGFFITRMLNAESYKLPRQVVSIEAVTQVLNYPFFGVGYQWNPAFTVKGKHYIAALLSTKDAELKAWREFSAPLPNLSLALQSIAQFGLIAMAWVFASLFAVNLRLRELVRVFPEKIQLLFAQRACEAYSGALLLLSLTSVDFRNPLVSLPFFIFWAMVQHFETIAAGRGLSGNKDAKLPRWLHTGNLGIWRRHSARPAVLRVPPGNSDEE